MRARRLYVCYAISCAKTALTVIDTDGTIPKRQSCTRTLKRASDLEACDHVFVDAAFWIQPGRAGASIRTP